MKPFDFIVYQSGGSDQNKASFVDPFVLSVTKLNQQQNVRQ